MLGRYRSLFVCLLTYLFFILQLIVTLSGATDFRGFLVIAHVPGQNMMLLGQFSSAQANHQILDCDIAMGVNSQAAIGHSGRINAPSTTFMWTAPNGPDGMVDFRYYYIFI